MKKSIFLIILSVSLFGSNHEIEQIKDNITKYIKLKNNGVNEAFRYLSSDDKREITLTQYKKYLKKIKENNIKKELNKKDDVWSILKRSNILKRKDYKVKRIFINKDKARVIVKYYKPDRDTYISDRLDLSFEDGPLSESMPEKKVLRLLLEKYEEEGLPRISYNKEMNLIKEEKFWVIKLTEKEKQDIIKIKGE